jgi:hypothetical protein
MATPHLGMRYDDRVYFRFFRFEGKRLGSILQGVGSEIALSFRFLVHSLIFS